MARDLSAVTGRPVNVLPTASPAVVGGLLQPPDRLGFARKLGILGRLPERLVTAIADGSHIVEYPAGGIALRWDEPTRPAILLSGSMRAFLSSPDGAQVTLRYLKVGDLIGTFDPRRPNFARGVQALAPARLLHLDAAVVAKVARREPLLAWALLEDLSGTLRETYHTLAIRAFGSVRTRVAHSLLEQAYVTNRVTRGAHLAFTQNELAGAVGSVREVVSAALSELREDGIVATFRGGVVILDPERLAVEADVGSGLAREIVMSTNSPPTLART